MVGFLESRVVRIFSVDGESLGTGYELGNGRVLTARHVVADHARVCVDDRTMTTAWRGVHEHHDVAVLATESEVAAPDVTAPDVAIFGGSPLGLEWCARGYPGLTGGIGKAFEGKVKRAQDPTRVQVSISVGDTAPPSSTECKGMSGSAVFIADRLWGVLCFASTYFRGSELTAVALPSLLELDGFRSAIGLLPLDQQRRAVARSYVLAALRPEVAAHFKRAGLSGGDVEALADAILDISPPSVLAKHCVAAIDSCRDRVQADGIREVFEWSLPHAIGRQRTARIGEDGCHRIRARYVETGEPVIAVDEERRMMMDPDLEPLGHVPLRSDKMPESGMLNREKARLVLDDLAETWLGRVELLDKHARLDWESKLITMSEEMAVHPPGRFYSRIDDVATIGGHELLDLLHDLVPNLRLMVFEWQSSTRDEIREEAALRANIDVFYKRHHAIVSGKP